MTTSGTGRDDDARRDEALRADTRVAGPFEGRRVDLIPTPIRIHDLSRGGCLIQSYHEQTPGRRFKLEIELPGPGWVRLEAEPLYNRPDYGFAVKFVNVPAETQAQLDDVIRTLIEQHRQR